MSILHKQGMYNLFFLNLGVGIGFANIFLKTRALTAEQIGLISILMSITSIVGYFVNFGMASGVLRFYSLFKDKLPQKTAFISVVFSSLAILFTLTSTIFWLLENKILDYYNNELLTSYLDYIYILLLFFGTNTILAAVFRSEYKAVKSNLITNSSEKAANFLFLGAMLIIDISYHAFVIFTVTIQLVKTLLFLKFFPKDVGYAKPDFSCIDRDFIYKFFSYSLFMLFSGLAGAISSTIDRLMLGHYINLDAVGIYVVVTSFPALIRMIGASFSLVAHSLIAEYWNTNQIDKISDLYTENTNFVLFIGTFVFAVFLLFGNNILTLLGRDYSGAYYVLAFLSLGEFINVSTGMCGGIIAFSKHYKFDFYIRIMLVILTIITNMIFIPKWGITGAAIATALTLGIYNIAKVIFTQLKFKMQPYTKYTLINLVHVVVLGLCIHLLTTHFEVENIFVIALLCIVFFVVYLALGAYVLGIPAAITLTHMAKKALKFKP